MQVAYKCFKSTGKVCKIEVYSFDAEKGVNYPDPMTGDLLEIVEPVNAQDYIWFEHIEEAWLFLRCHINSLLRGFDSFVFNQVEGEYLSESMMIDKFDKMLKLKEEVFIDSNGFPYYIGYRNNYYQIELPSKAFISAYNKLSAEENLNLAIDYISKL